MADSSRKYSFLERLSVERLEELLDSAVNTNEEENSEYIDAILEVIVKKEKETPTGRITDVDQAWKDFQTYYNTEDGRGQTLYFVEEQKQPVETAAPKHITFRRMWNREEESARREPSIKVSEVLPYFSFQEALDSYSITEVIEPSRLPDGYAFDHIAGLDASRLSLDAVYTNGENIFSISILEHNGNPSAQVEKTAKAPEIFEVGNTTFYLIENTANYTVVWLTEHYECFIIAPLSVERDELKDIVYSMF